MNRKSSKPRKGRNSLFAHLKRLISPYANAVKDGIVRHWPSKEGIVSEYNHRGYPRGLVNKTILDHLEGRITLYFWGDGRCKSRHAMVMVDIDCHKVGSLEAARAFALHLRERYFPGMF